MKTKRVRPILISTYNKVHDTYMIDRLEYQIDKKLSINGIEQELILISLEDEKIDHEKDRYFESSNGSIKTIIKAGLNIKTIGRYYNIAARQSQIPPEYISKFIEQYNNNCVEDLEIEMKHYWINSDSIKGKFFTEVAKFEPSINQYDAILNNRPKLTNGFVTIVEKSDNFTKFLKERIDNASSTETKAAYAIVLAQYKKEILYTEEEVKQLLSKFGNHIMIHPNLDFGEEYEEAINWFENNKKK